MFLVCKIIDPKIRSCKIVDKFHVWILYLQFWVQFQNQTDNLTLSWVTEFGSLTMVLTLWNLVSSITHSLTVDIAFHFQKKLRRKFFLKELDHVLTRWSDSPKPSCMSCVICQAYTISYLIQTAIHLWDAYSEGIFLKKIEIRLPNIKIATAWLLGSPCQVYVSPCWRWINNWGHRWGILSRDYFLASGDCSRR